MADAEKPDFSFVQDDKLRELLADYFDQAFKATESGCYLGAIATYGSIVEGILTWALKSREEAALKHSSAPKDKKSGEVPPLNQCYLRSLNERLMKIRPSSKEILQVPGQREAVFEFQRRFESGETLGLSA